MFEYDDVQRYQAGKFRPPRIEMAKMEAAVADFEPSLSPQLHSDWDPTKSHSYSRKRRHLVARLTAKLELFDTHELCGICWLGGRGYHHRPDTCFSIHPDDWDKFWRTLGFSYLREQCCWRCLKPSEYCDGNCTKPGCAAPLEYVDRACTRPRISVPYLLFGLLAAPEHRWMKLCVYADNTKAISECLERNAWPLWHGREGYKVFDAFMKGVFSHTHRGKVYAAWLLLEAALDLWNVVGYE